jgi:hypothetical protein
MVWTECAGLNTARWPNQYFLTKSHVHIRLDDIDPHQLAGIIKRKGVSHGANLGVG